MFGRKQQAANPRDLQRGGFTIAAEARFGRSSVNAPVAAQPRADVPAHVAADWTGNRG